MGDRFKTESVIGMDQNMHLLRLFSIVSLLLLLFGCAVRGVVVNTPGPVPGNEPSYSIRTFQQKWETDENALMLAFSGGGTRAAALSYGVLKELRAHLCQPMVVASACCSWPG